MGGSAGRRFVQALPQLVATACQVGGFGGVARQLDGFVVREFLGNANPILAQAIDEHPDFRPSAWIDEHLHRTRDGRGD